MFVVVRCVRRDPLFNLGNVATHKGDYEIILYSPKLKLIALSLPKADRAPGHADFLPKGYSRQAGVPLFKRPVVACLQSSQLFPGLRNTRFNI